MSKQREALEMALHALEEIAAHYPADWEFDICVYAKSLLREALADLDKTEHRFQCWDANSPEHGSLDPQSMAEYFADNMCDDESANFEVMVSIPLPDRIMRVELSDGEKREMSWEWVE